MAVPRTTVLAQIISTNVITVNEFLSTSNLPQLSFDAALQTTYPLHLPAEVKKAREVAIAASQELRALLLGPVDHVLGSAGDVHT